MEERRTDKSIKNIIYAIVGQFFGIGISLISRLVFVKILSSEYLGLSSLFTNILTILSLTEMGFGTAMAFELYRPIARNDKEKIKSLMKLYKKIYIIIGTSIIILGIITIPIYPHLINERPNINNLDLIYMLFVLNTAFSYFAAYKRLLIISDQNRYIATTYRYGFYIVMNVMQIIELVLFKNYILYLIIQVLFTLLENIGISIKANKMYPYLKDKEVKEVAKRDKKHLMQNVKALFFHRFGGVVLNSTDNIVISKVLGLNWVGLYSNYYLITNALNTVLNQVFSSVVASIGNLNTSNTREKMTDTFNKIFFANVWIYAVVCSALLVLINPFIEIWLGRDYIISFGTVIVLVVNFFVYGMRRPAMAFREATGNYRKDWYSPIIEAVINIFVSIVMAKYIGLAGVFIGTIISSLCTNFWLEPFVICKKSLKINLKQYFLMYLKYALVVLITVIFTYIVTALITIGGLCGLIIRGIISVVIPILILILIYFKNEYFKYYRAMFKRKILKK